MYKITSIISSICRWKVIHVYVWIMFLQKKTPMLLHSADIEHALAETDLVRISDRH